MQTTAFLLLILGVGYSLADIAGSCSEDPNDRYDCGWEGIDNSTCEDRGCCYDDTDFGFETKWCFYPTEHKCYGIAPEERDDCGYYGIQREECENVKGCCFDHTVSDVAWCFHGSEPAVPGEATVPPTEPEEGTEEPTEEAEEASEGAEEATEGAEEATEGAEEATEGAEEATVGAEEATEEPEEGAEEPGEGGEVPEA